VKADPFMLELFSKEAREHCAALEKLRKGEADARAGLRAATSLKGAARLLGLAKYADLCEKIEDFLKRHSGATKFNSSFSFAVDALSEIAAAEPAEIDAALGRLAGKLDEALASDFLAEDAPAEAPVSAAADDSSETLPQIEASMKPLFLEEARNHTAALSETLVELEDDFSNAKKLEKLMRSSHSLKGAARVVGLSLIVDFTHEMENCFVAAQNAQIAINSDSLDALLKCADFLSGLCASGFEKYSRSAFAENLENLRRISAGKSARVSASPKPAGGAESARKARDSFVKVSPKSLSALMELSAEILIENRRAEIYRESSSSIKESQERLVRQFENAMNALEGTPGAEAAIARFEQIRKSMRAIVGRLRSQTESLGEYSRRNVVLSDRLYAEVSASRMRPFSDCAAMFPRLVRDLAKESGKRITLEIVGKDVPVDRDVLEMLESPLTHLLRNACDHGIETPAARLEAGKRESGKIVLRAWHSSGFLMLGISDDGAGLDERKIRAKILERKLVAPEILEKMSSDEVFEFLFLPNFTTKENVTQVSGRGVGLDVVRTMLREIGGSISVSSVYGAGSTFTMKLPITRSVIKSLAFLVGDEPYAFALGRVYRTLKLSPSDIEVSGGARHFWLDGRKVRLFRLGELLGFGRSRQKQADEIYIVALAEKGRVFGFEVDALPSEAELVARPLHESLGKIPCVSAASLDEEGRPVLILDADDILANAEKFSERGIAAAEEASDESSEAKLRVLVVDDSATVRETQRKILEAAGYAVDVAVDGMDGWNCFRLSKYDIVVSDVDMPRLTGFGLVEKIRSVNKYVPVVIVSYKDRSEDRARGKAAGANAYLTKSSFQDDSFLKTVRSLLKVES